MPQRVLIIANWFTTHIWNVVCGIFFAFISYFAEMKGAFHVMFAAFMVDLILGIMASKIVRNEKFSMHKFFVAWYRMLISYALVMLLYAMNKEMHQDTVSIENIVSWTITGFLIYSAAENGYELTGGRILLNIKSMIRNKVQENTGIDLDKD